MHKFTNEHIQKKKKKKKMYIYIYKDISYAHYTWETILCNNQVHTSNSCTYFDTALHELNARLLSCISNFPLM